MYVLVLVEIIVLGTRIIMKNMIPLYQLKVASEFLERNGSYSVYVSISYEGFVVQSLYV